jgi:6-phosphofructokinase 1
MNWLFQMHTAQPVAHAIGVLALVCVAGMAVGSLKVRGVGLGTAGVLFAGATVANQDVNFTLIPEVPFKLDGPNGLLLELKERLKKRAHAVVVVAEGAGQELFEDAPADKDPSGNMKLKDIGLLLRERIKDYFKEANIPITMRYFEPSYLIRSSPANAADSILCDLYARNAVHAAMAGKIGLVIGYLHDVFIHIPIKMLVLERKRIVDQIIDHLNNRKNP